ncbi:hypothetical protein [Amycolatopsis pigmentata]|uniref:Zinc-ribbon domain-containing protein n=1 Tax=Amycolatopsis pigmentata TaxID=450801 RepID=A0ABW5G5T1_9PSEU
MNEQFKPVFLYVDGDGEPVYGRIDRGRKSWCPTCGQDAHSWRGWNDETGWISDHAAPDFSECGDTYGVFQDEIPGER